MFGKLVLLVTMAATVVSAIPAPGRNASEPAQNERTLACLYATCGTGLSCTNANYYCGYDLLCGYRCFPKKCIGFCSTSSQCLSGACTLNLCQSCLG